jgi:uncharacterized protein (TIGR03435 family)
MGKGMTRNKNQRRDCPGGCILLEFREFVPAQVLIRPCICGKGSFKMTSARWMRRSLPFMITLVATLVLMETSVARSFAQGAQASGGNTATSATSDVVGTWQGVLHAGRDVRLVVKVSKGAKSGYEAVLTNADEGGSMPAATLTLENGTVQISSAAMGTFFEGQLSADGKSIAGQWKLAPSPLPLTLDRATPETAWTVAPPPAAIPPMAANANPSFEVATIKPNNSGLPQLQGIIVRGRQFRTINSSLEDLISFAYSVQVKQIVNGPAWISSERYDIEGVPDAAGTPNVEQLRVMMRKLLADRFKLTFHKEQRDLSAYVLSVAKGGEKLTPNESKGALPGLGIGPGKGGVTLHIMNAAMPDFASFLQQVVLDRPVVDRTGLTGNYDFSCTFAPDDSEFGGHPPFRPASPQGAAGGAAAGSQASPTGAATTATAAESDAAPSLFEAMQQQLGLKLSAEKTAVDVIAIDHADHPSPN